MTRTVADYTALIPPANANKPKFVATIQASVAPLVAMQGMLADLPSEFDIDNAVGPQLDAVGVRVGRSRQLPYPLQGIFFTWGDPARGWGKGVWKGRYSAGVGLYELDDDTYRRLLRAKVLANRWDGSLIGAQGILNAYFDDPETLVFVVDNGFGRLNSFFTWGDPSRGWGRGVWKSPQDAADDSPLPMAMTIGVAGKLPSLIDLGLLAQGAFDVKPLGVTMTYRVTSVNQKPVFGWGMSNAYVSGWGQGAWGVAPETIATLVTN